MDIAGKTGIITGAASGIGRAAAKELKKYDIGALALVDMSDSVYEVAADLNAENGNDSVRASRSSLVNPVRCTSPSSVTLV